MSRSPSAAGEGWERRGDSIKVARAWDMEGTALLAVIATMRVKPNMEKEFEAVAKELAANVN